MQRQPLVASQRDRIASGLPFVESLARRVAASMPHSIELNDLVQDGMLGLIDAACRFDEARGIKFETFAERRVRGAMIDALRRDAWPRGVRRQRREIEAAREQLRRELGAEPSLADIWRRASGLTKSVSAAPSCASTPSSRRPRCRPPSTSTAPRCRRRSCRRSRPRPTRRTRRARSATACARRSRRCPPRERKVISMYYYAEATMKQIGDGDRRQRIARVAAARPRGAAPAQGARRRVLRRRSGRRAAPGDPVVPADDAPDADGEGRDAEPPGGRAPVRGAARKAVAHRVPAMPQTERIAAAR